jgi:hypothetical protein
VAGQALAQLAGARPVATAWCSRPGRLRSAGAVALLGHSWPGLWRGRYVAWEVAVDRGRGMAGVAGLLRGTADQGSRPRPLLAGCKTKYKGVECKGKTQICM